MYSKNDVCPAPPMGWNSYDYYDTTVNEQQIRENAQYMHDRLAQYGWEYIVIDIQWSDPNAGTKRPETQYIPFSHFSMDEYGRQTPAVNRFPSAADGKGFEPLASFIHSLGLKFGIHIMRGIPRLASHLHLPVKGTSVTADKIANPYSISRWNPDMYGVRYDAEGAQEYYDSIFELYAQWGVDFVKVDDICNTNMYPASPYSAEKEIEMIARAIEKCGRPIVLSLSPGPAVIEKAYHLERHANMWRITDDFWDEWHLLKNMFERCAVWQNHVRPGCWPDCDMLPIGILGKGFGHEWPCRFTDAEQKTMMTLWCMFRSPLMIGTDLPRLDSKTASLLTNTAVLDLLRNSHGAFEYSRTESEALWCSVRTAPSDTVYIALFNLSGKDRTVTADISAILHETEKRALISAHTAVKEIRDVWTGEKIDDILCYLPERSSDQAAHDDINGFTIRSKAAYGSLESHGCMLISVKI